MTSLLEALIFLQCKSFLHCQLTNQLQNYLCHQRTHDQLQFCFVVQYVLTLQQEGSGLSCGLFWEECACSYAQQLSLVGNTFYDCPVHSGCGCLGLSWPSGANKYTIKVMNTCITAASVSLVTSNVWKQPSSSVNEGWHHCLSSFYGVCFCWWRNKNEILLAKISRVEDFEDLEKFSVII